MKIARLLELHRQSSPQYSLAQNLGDGFLMQYNFIYRAVRLATIQKGYKYTLNTSSAYLALPLSQLEVMLKETQIPYIDNVSVLTDIEKKMPMTTDWFDISDNLKRNSIFHESCHAVARVEAEKIFPNQKADLKKIARLLLEESFANACELLAVVDAEQKAHQIFFEANSYCLLFEERNLLKELIQQLGLRFIFKFTMFCYWHSNFLYENADDRILNRLITFSFCENEKQMNLKLDIKTLKKLRAILKMSFQLNPRFRETTTGFYMRLLGFKFHKQDFTKYDFIDLLDSDKCFFYFSEELIKIFPNES